MRDTRETLPSEKQFQPVDPRELVGVLGGGGGRRTISLPLSRRFKALPVSGDLVCDDLAPVQSDEWWECINMTCDDCPDDW